MTDEGPPGVAAIADSRSEHPVQVQHKEILTTRSIETDLRLPPSSDMNAAERSHAYAVSRFGRSARAVDSRQRALGDHHAAGSPVDRSPPGWLRRIIEGRHRMSRELLDAPVGELV